MEVLSEKIGDYIESIPLGMFLCYCIAALFLLRIIEITIRAFKRYK